VQVCELGLRVALREGLGFALRSRRTVRAVSDRNRADQHRASRIHTEAADQAAVRTVELTRKRFCVFRAGATARAEGARGTVR
jgi:hypothetical protein